MQKEWNIIFQPGEGKLPQYKPSQSTRTPVAGVLLQRPYSSEWESGFKASLAGKVLGNRNNLVKNIIHP